MTYKTLLSAILGQGNIVGEKKKFDEILGEKDFLFQCVNIRSIKKM